jgi:[protein-PII] uridylyltransferase
VAGGLALLGLPVLRADVSTERGIGASTWQVGGEEVDEARLREVLRHALNGHGHGLARIRRRPAVHDGPPPSVVVHPDASRSATVLEVRASDRPGLLHDICVILERLELDIRSAHLDTLGPQAVDVFYVCGPSGLPLAERAQETADVLRDSLASAPMSSDVSGYPCRLGNPRPEC